MELFPDKLLEIKFFFFFFFQKFLSRYLVACICGTVQVNIFAYAPPLLIA